MNSFSEMIYKYNTHWNHKINKFCDPILSHFRINHFWYYKVTKDGYYTCLGSNLQWMEYYFDQKLYLPNPYLRNPENFDTSVSLISQIKDDSYQQSIELAIKKFNINQNLIFLNKVKDGIEGYGFASSLPTNHFEALCLNEMALLKLFIKRFEEEFNSLLIKMSDNLVDIASLIGPSFYGKNPIIQAPSINKHLILKQLQLAKILDLTIREKEVLFLVSRGVFAAQIADNLQLSKRTIEHYIENIKNKLNCYSKAELIQKANEFLSLGYSLP